MDCSRWCGQPSLVSCRLRVRFGRLFAAPNRGRLFRHCRTRPVYAVWRIAGGGTPAYAGAHQRNAGAKPAPGSPKGYAVKFRFQQITRQGLWTSECVFEGDYADIVAQVVQGHVRGQPRAAIEHGSDRVIFALDADGRATLAAAGLFGLGAAQAA